MNEDLILMILERYEVPVEKYALGIMKEGRIAYWTKVVNIKLYIRKVYPHGWSYMDQGSAPPFSVSSV